MSSKADTTKLVDLAYTLWNKEFPNDPDQKKLVYRAWHLILQDCPYDQLETDQEVKTGITTDLKAKTPSITHHKTTRTSTEDTRDLDHKTDIGIPTSNHAPFFKTNNNTITIDQWDNNNTTITSRSLDPLCFLSIILLGFVLPHI